MSNLKTLHDQNEYDAEAECQHEHFDTLLEQYESKHLSRRQLFGALVASAASISMTPVQGQAPAAVGRPMNHGSLSADGVQRSADFYRRVLRLEISSRTASGSFNVGMGSESFLGLYELGNPGRMHHLCVGLDNYNPDLLAGRLSNHGIQANINRDPVNRTSGGDQLYFNDPERILVQLVQPGYLG